MTEQSTGPMEASCKDGNTVPIPVLVDRARTGDRHAFDRLVVLFQDSIYNMAYYQLHCRMDAEDLTQDVFVQALQNLSGLKRADLFRQWLFRIATNKIRDFQRKRRVLDYFRIAYGHNVTQHSDAHDAHSILFQREFWGHVQSFLKRLSRLEKEVFLLRFQHELSMKEIAQILGRKESTVKTCLFRAIKKFRNESELLKLISERRK